MSVAIRILIADDHGLYRRGLSVFLKDHFLGSEVTEAASLQEAETLIANQTAFDLALFDLLMPGMKGPMTLAPLRSRHPNLKIAIVAASESKNDVLDTVAAGLSGFIPKTLPRDEFIAALSMIVAGQIYVPGHMLRLEQKPEAAPIAPVGDLRRSAVAALTPRQKDVLECVRKGMSNREIGDQLGISIGTVKIHIATLLAAMKVSNRIQLATT